MGKLSEKQVHEICKLAGEGYTNKEIGKMFNVGDTTVSRIRRGLIYKKITANYDLDKMSSRKNMQDIDTVKKICSMIEKGGRTNDIAAEVNVLPSLVSNIRRGLSYTSISKDYDLNARTITEENVHKVCQMMEMGYRNIDIAREVDLDAGTISAIRTKKYYTNISSQYNIDSTYERRILTDEEVHKICKMINEGYTYANIQDEVKVSSTVIVEIRYLRAHKNIGIQYGFKPTKIKNGRIELKRIHEVCKLLENSVKIMDISKITKVSPTTINRIRYGTSYGEISSQYNIPKRTDRKELDG